MCRFRLQYESLDYQWVDKVTFPAKKNKLVDGCF